MNLKHKAISGVIWNISGNIANHIITFIVGIVLARLLTPKDYGLIGMTTMLIVISQTFIESGFRQALIRKQNCTNEDYSTIFLFNLFIAVIIYVILFFLSNYIALFFNEPELKNIIRVISFSLIISSLGIIQYTIFSKNINFKLLSWISLISSLVSGLVGIILAYKNFGVWSLVIKTLCGDFINIFLWWSFSKWKPMFIFSRKSFKELFNFGSKLLITNLIDQFFWTIYYSTIGKFFSIQTLGYYTRAEMFKNLPSQNLTFVINAVAFPTLSALQKDSEALKNSFKKFFLGTMLISTILILGMAATAKALVLVLIGEKWITTANYLQFLCIAALLFPASVLNSTILKVYNRSDLILKIEIIRKLITIPSIFIGILFGIKIMLGFFIINSIIDYFLYSYWSGKIINYSWKSQVWDLIPTLLVGFVFATAVFLFGLPLSDNQFSTLIIQMIIGIILLFFLFEIFKINSYVILKKTLFEYLIKK
ncbi:MAG: lipopolysaccharide biosynthesis protein [Thermaurantimonas sp.]|uniref:lipopolysaccharide biosynthesis protein n=1 Tax=Thermaurantimonas sp. TaxID=2681568 RepID=UPI00391D701F